MVSLAPDTSHAPLTSKERLLYGGLGAVAPLAVSAVTQDLAALFANVTLIAALGYGAKGVLLFVLGGVVGFLHKSETDAWKCFVIGISAPALLTTAAKAEEAPKVPEAAIATFISTKEIGFFRETPWQQFLRGFKGSNPNTQFYVVGQFKDEKDAKLSAAQATLAFNCGAFEKRASTVRAERAGPPLQPFVIKRPDNTYLSMLTYTEGTDLLYSPLPVGKFVQDGLMIDAANKGIAVEWFTKKAYTSGPTGDWYSSKDLVPDCADNLVTFYSKASR